MRIRILIALAFLLTSCGSINFRIGNHNLSNSNSKIILNQSELNVKTYTTNHQVFANLDPMDFGLNHGNYMHCRIHGFHDLTWFDPLYSPYFCRPTQWNNNWMWHHNQNTWNNWMWRPYLGNAHYGNWNGWNTWSPYGPLYGYNGRNIYNGRYPQQTPRIRPIGRRNQPQTPRIRPTRTRPTQIDQPSRPVRTEPRTRPTRLDPPSKPVRTEPRTRPTKLDPPSRPVRTGPRTRPTRMDPPSRPVRTEPITRPTRLNPPARPVRTRTVPNAPSRTSGNTTSPSRRRQ